MNKTNQAYRDIVAQKLQMEVEGERRLAMELRAQYPKGSPGVVASQKHLDDAIERRDATLAWLDDLINERDAAMRVLDDAGVRVRHPDPTLSDPDRMKVSSLSERVTHVCDMFHRILDDRSKMFTVLDKHNLIDEVERVTDAV